jgi:probable HAF family extracellular repeat protein
MLAGAAGSTAAPPSLLYSIVEIRGDGIGDRFDIRAYGLNDKGDVAGNATASPSPGVRQSHAFRFDYSSRTLIRLDTFGGFNSGAVAINNSGTSVGIALASGSSERGAIWDAKGGAVRPGPFENVAVGPLADINNRGTITATATFEDGSVSAAIVKGTHLIPLGTLGGPTSEGRAISDRGHVAGISRLADNSTHAFLYYRSEMEDLGVLPGGFVSVATDVNSRGEVVGFATIGPDSTECCDPTPQHAFRYRNGTLQDLGTLGGNDPTLQSEASAINDLGEIVGQSQMRLASETVWRPFLYRKGQMIDLTTIIDPSDPLLPYAQFESALAINEKGWVLLNGYDSRDNVARVYLLVRQ